MLKGSIFHFAPKCFQNRRKLQKTAQNEPKLRESCTPWQKLRACMKTRMLRKSCAAQHRNFLGGTTQEFQTLEVIIKDKYLQITHKVKYVFLES